MGVKGLTNFLRARINGTKEILSSSRLAIDGYGFMFHILNSMQYDYTTFSYYSWHECIRTHIEYLQSTLGFRLTVFFDGSRRQLKLATTELRDQKSDERWQNLLDMCTCGDAFSQSDMPIAELCTQQFISTLIQMQVETIFCEAEADPVMSKWCVDNGAYCHAQDRYTTYYIHNIALNSLFFTSVISSS
jgi:hypothetical protein